MMRSLLTTLLAALVAALAAVPFAAMFGPPAPAAATLGAAVLAGAAIGPWLFSRPRRAIVGTVLAVFAGSALTVLGEPPATLAAAAAVPFRLLIDGWWDLLTVPLPVPADPVFLALPLVLAFLAAAAASRGLHRRRFALVAWPLLALWLAGLVVGLGPAAPVAVVAPLPIGLGAAAVLVRAGSTRTRPGRMAAGAAVLALGAVAAVPLAAAAAAGAADPVDPRDQVTPPVESVPLVNPLDMLIGQIRSGSDQPVFTATTDLPPATPFWTVAAMDIYDGRSWQPGAALTPAAGRVAGDTGTSSAEARQQLTVGEDLAPWVPHLGSVAGIDSRGLLLARDSDLLVDPTAALSDAPAERSYDLVGAWSTADLEALRTARVAEVPTGSPLLDVACLPADVTAAVAETAAGATNPFDRAAAVVHWMRQSSGLQASREVLSGHSCLALLGNLGQVADQGTVAASVDQLATVQTLALRSQGIPARVAVGYAVTAPDQDGTYAAKASHATAYSQIHLDGIGWIDIAAEPQGGGGTADKAATAVSAAGMLEAAASAPPAASAQSQEPAAEQPTEEGTSEDTAAGLAPAVLAAAAAAGLVVALPLLVLVVNRTRVRLRRRRRGSGDPRSQVLGAWAEVRDALAGSGIDTTGQTALQTAQELPEQSQARERIQPLADLVQRATYDPRPVPQDTARQAWSLATAARRALARNRSRRQRIVRYLLPARAAQA